MWTRDEDTGQERLVPLDESYGTYPSARPVARRPRLRCPDCCKHWGHFLALLVVQIAFSLLLSLSNSSEAFIGFVLVTWLCSLCLHEFFHASAAYYFGDIRVKESGYLHMDISAYSHFLISVFVPMAFLYFAGLPLPGGAVYINQSALRGRFSKSLVALAGPLANLVCMVMLWTPFLYHEGPYEGPYLVDGNATDQNALLQAAKDLAAHTRLWQGLALSVFFQLSALVLNLLPLPPLDGFNALLPWLPPSVTRLFVQPQMWFFSLASLLLVVLVYYTLGLNLFLLHLMQYSGIPVILAQSGLVTLLAGASALQSPTWHPSNHTHNQSGGGDFDPYGLAFVELVAPGR
eukprot:gb/GEZN01008768.1/.p1 GENE.gb/GEZN01008768.1/~~gb/GEZN01008768.1/.p1  ORF type:complete len:347 (+),score=25.66 gb/GEZN01008768.1/:37-1077(+)